MKREDVIQKLKERVLNLQALVRHCDSPAWDNPRFDMINELTKKDKELEDAILALEQKEQSQPEREESDLRPCDKCAFFNFYKDDYEKYLELKRQVIQPEPERSAEEFIKKYPFQTDDDNEKWYSEEDVCLMLQEYRSQGLPEVTDEMINEYSIRQIKDAFNKLLPNEGDYMPFDADLVLAMRNCLRIGAEDMRDGKIKQLTGK